MGGGNGGGGDNNNNFMNQEQASFQSQENALNQQIADQQKQAAEQLLQQEQTNAVTDAQSKAVENAQGSSQQMTGDATGPQSLLMQPGRVDATVRAGIPNFAALAALYRPGQTGGPKPGGSGSNVSPTPAAAGQSNQIGTSNVPKFGGG